MPRPFLPLLAGALLLGTPFTAAPCLAAPDAEAYDVVVYGGTSAGVMAAVDAGRSGAKVVLIEPSYLLGGMMAGGLTKTDIGKKETIGGLSREFYSRVVAYYTKAYGADSEQVKQTNGGFFFEPKAAGQIFRDMLSEAGVVVRTKEQLDGLAVEGSRIVSLTTRTAEGTRRYAGKVFIDGTYEGDILPAANVPYRVGREARSEYGESLAGFSLDLPPYAGSGDHRVQSYNIRGTLTDRDDLRVEIPKPDNYYPEASAAVVSTAKAHNYRSLRELFSDVDKWGAVNGKFDSNRADFIGANLAYVEGDPEARARILKRVQDYWLSYWWRLQNDPDLSDAFKADARRWGLPKDEYEESGHVTPQLYVREGRRLMGRYLLTQRDLLYDRSKPDAICQGSYTLDSHEVEILRLEGGNEAEGKFNQSVDAYEIPYRSLLPYGIDNLLAVCAVSATHVAYASLRMEPVFMMLGQAGGAAAGIAVAKNLAVQDVPVPELQAKLKGEGALLEAPFRPVVRIQVKTPPPYQAGTPIELEAVPVTTKTPLSFSWNFDGSGAVQATAAAASHAFPPGPAHVVLLARDGDDNQTLPESVDLDVAGDGGVPLIEVPYTQAKIEGRWERTRGSEVEYRARVGLVAERKGETARMTFTAVPSRTGFYVVAFAFPSAGNRATNVPVSVVHADGEAKIVLDERKKATPFAFAPLGTFRFEAGKPASVTVSSVGATGVVAADAVRWIWAGETLGK